MAALTDSAQQDLLDHICGEGLRNMTSPATLYLALHSADPGEAGTANELSGLGYARQAMTFGGATLADPSVAATTDAQTFTASGGSWSVTHVSIWSASTAGQALFHGAMTASKTVNDGDDLVFAIGAVTCSLT